LRLFEKSSMSDPFEGRPFPRGVLIGAAALIAFVIAAVALVRLTGVGGTETPPAPVQFSVELRFDEQDDGKTLVYAATDPEAIAVLESGVDGYVLGVLRAMARERRGYDVAMSEPYQLMLLEDGRLIFRDTATGREIDLRAFGPTNAQSFADLLDDVELPPSSSSPDAAASDQAAPGSQADRR
jgi:putative photosynthetic complex assembly protein